MEQTLKPTQAVQIVDLVLEPDFYHDALLSSVRQDGLDCDDTEHLAALLPLAIAQLDAVGDEYGIIALEGLYGQLLRLHETV